MSDPLKQKVDVSRMIFYACTIILLILAFARFSQIRLLTGLFNRHNIIYLAGVIFLQLGLTNYALALNYRDVLLMKDIRVPMRELFVMTFIVTFISQVLPSGGVSGQVFFVYFLRKYNVRVSAGMNRAILEVFTLYIAYAFFFVTAVILLFEGGVFVSHPRVAWFVYAYLAFISFCAFVIYVSQRERRSKLLAWAVAKAHSYVEKNDALNEIWNKRQEHVAMGIKQLQTTFAWSELRQSLPLLIRATLWQAVVLACNVATLYLIGYAIGSPFPLSAAFIAFTLAKLISIVSFFPGAPIAFEAGVAWLLLTLGVGSTPAIAAGIIYAAFSFWLPMPLGWFLYGKYLKKFALANDNGRVS